MKKREKVIYRKSVHTEGLSFQDKILRILYGNRAGRILLSLLIRPEISIVAGMLMDSSLSKLAIRPFVRRNHIDMSMCRKTEFSSYNDFFKRKLIAGARPVDDTVHGFISPCDGRLTVYDIADTHSSLFNIKDSEYTVEALLRDKKLAERYRGGKLWLFRLCVDDYHRYIYNVDGVQSYVRRIDGVYHTVNPIAGEYYDIYKENTREYCVIKTTDMGTVVDMEVGALLVGRIENRYNGSRRVRRGEEKGNFAFGGSTIIILTQKDRATPIVEIARNSRAGKETRIRQGEIVGTTK